MYKLQRDNIKLIQLYKDNMNLIRLLQDENKYLKNKMIENSKILVDNHNKHHQILKNIKYHLKKN